MQQRNISHHTVLSYRDSRRLFLRFGAGRKNKPVSHLGLTDLTEPEVLAFLQYTEKERKTSIVTRNCRLAGLRSLFHFVAEREPLVEAQCAEILRIPTKRAPQGSLCHLEDNEVSAILDQPNQSKVEGQRDQVLLAVLYNTGARIQEALNINPRALRLESPSHVRLFGKGRKERICPLWPETVALLKALLRKQPQGEDESIFVNRYGRPLGAAGVRFKLKHYVEAAGRNTPSLFGKRISPDTFRHSTAVSLVTAGVDVTVIRDWLGHASLDTTNHYARANVETKRKALEKVDPAVRPGKPPRWKRNPELMAWLDSL